MENEILEKTVKTQFGTAASADFEDNTWTFEMPEDFSVWPGEFAIVDKGVYERIVEILKICNDPIGEGEGLSDYSDLLKLL